MHLSTTTEKALRSLCSEYINQIDNTQLLAYFQCNTNHYAVNILSKVQFKQWLMHFLTTKCYIYISTTWVRNSLWGRHLPMRSNEVWFLSNFWVECTVYVHKQCWRMRVIKAQGGLLVKIQTKKGKRIKKRKLPNVIDLLMWS